MARKGKKYYRQLEPEFEPRVIRPPSKDFRLSDYARTRIDHKSSLKGLSQSINTVNIDTIKNLLRNPESNYAQIGAYMEDLYKKNGLVGNIINYFSTLPSFNYTIMPKLTPEKGFNTGLQIEDYLGPSQWIENFNIRFFVAYFMRQTLIHGASFFYEFSDAEGVAYVEFPASMCRIYAQENGIYRWAVNMDAIKADMVQMEGFPEEIVTAFNQKSNRANNDQYFDGKWLMLADQAFAFSFNMSVIKNGGVSVSELLSLIVDSITVEKTKENVQVKDDIDTVRFLWGKAPIDKDGVPQMSPEEIFEWQSLFENGLPDGVATVVTPFEMTGINLSNAGSKRAYETVDDAQKQFFLSSGVPKAMFDGDTKSSRIIEMSMIKDEAWVFSYCLPVVEAYYKQVMRKYSDSKGYEWDFKFLRQSIYSSTFIPNLEKSLAQGGSRTEYLAALGMTPQEIFGKLYMEQNVLNIDSFMVPKSTAHTMSGSSSDSGRPKSNVVTEDTERIQDAE